MGVLGRLAVERQVIEDRSLISPHLATTLNAKRQVEAYPVRAAVREGNAGLVDHEALAAAVGHRDDRRVLGRVQREQRACGPGRSAMSTFS